MSKPSFPVFKDGNVPANVLRRVRDYATPRPSDYAKGMKDPAYLKVRAAHSHAMGDAFSRDAVRAGDPRSEIVDATITATAPLELVRDALLKCINANLKSAELDPISADDLSDMLGE